MLKELNLFLIKSFKMFNKLLNYLFLSYFKNINTGSLKIELPNDKIVFYQSNKPGYQAHIKIKTWWVFCHAVARGNIALAADYRDGFWDTDNLTDLLLFGATNNALMTHYSSSMLLFKLLSRTLYWFRRNTIKQSKKNIHDHYDLGNNFYKLWLDETMTYSSAMFTTDLQLDYTDKEVLKTGQITKYNFILDKLTIDKSNITKVLEIGCGWGGFAENLLKKSDQIHYQGYTLSDEQYKIIIEKISSFSNKSSVLIADYREITGSYDYIVSIEMLEAVGMEYWAEYFKIIKNALKPNGKVFIQTIVIKDEYFDEYVKRDDMIRTFIFPGGMLPCMAELYKQFDNNGLSCSGVHQFGSDYAHTLQAWLWNFNQAQEYVMAQGFDKQFIRMWSFYLAFCIAGFVSKRIDVVMLELIHKD